MTWTFSNITDCKGPDLIIRCYLEQQGVRRTLKEKVGYVNRAADVGCGYGRLSMVLTEYANEVWGFEREPRLVNIARPLMPQITFENISSLTKLPVEGGYFDFVMTFTVLQHILTEKEASAVIQELKRIVGQGYVLLVEKICTENGNKEPKWNTIRRSIQVYKQWMKPFELIWSTPRVIEPTCPKKNVGTYMLFQGRG